MRHEMEDGAHLAQSFIGTETLGWAPLTDATLIDKASKGYDTPAPLLRDGTLRESYRGEAEFDGREIIGRIGTSDERAEWLENGTSRMAERPVSAPAMVQHEPNVLHAFSELALRTLTVR